MSEVGTGPARFGPTPASVVPGSTAAPKHPHDHTESRPRKWPTAPLSVTRQIVVPVLPMQGNGQPALMRKSTPIRVVIPAIGVDFVLMRLWTEGRQLASRRRAHH